MVLIAFPAISELRMQLHCNVVPIRIVTLVIAILSLSYMDPLVMPFVSFVELQFHRCTVDFVFSMPRFFPWYEKALVLASEHDARKFVGQILVTVLVHHGTVPTARAT